VLWYWGIAVMNQQYLSSAEAAKRLGVSTKALRLYERRGLVAPIRNNAGWRAYGPAEISRLHQVLALKNLGLPLARIADLLAAAGDTLDSVLELQERALKKESTQVAHALSLVRTARRKLAHGTLLTIDDLATLTLEATALTPFLEKYFTQSELDDIMERDDLHREEHLSTWDGLFAELKEVAARGDRDSLQALDLGRRWLAQSELFTRGDAKLSSQLKAVTVDAMADPDTVAKLPITREMYDCIARIMQRVNDEIQS
jgi:MerR family transcriptional regulator, thiopeptide resistance regulator